MKEYKEFQWGVLILAFLIPTHIFLFISFILQLGSRPIDMNGFIIINLVFAATDALFYGMTTKVTDEKVVILFGIGLIRRTIGLNRIASVVNVQNPWYYGWRIHFIPNGMLYNISGSYGVELTLNDNGRAIRIGTKNQKQLREEILKRLKPHPRPPSGWRGESAQQT